MSPVLPPHGGQRSARALPVLLLTLGLHGVVLLGVGVGQAGGQGRALVPAASPILTVRLAPSRPSDALQSQSFSVRQDTGQPVDSLHATALASVIPVEPASSAAMAPSAAATVLAASTVPVPAAASNAAPVPVASATLLAADAPTAPTAPTASTTPVATAAPASPASIAQPSDEKLVNPVTHPLIDTGSRAVVTLAQASEEPYYKTQELSVRPQVQQDITSMLRLTVPGVTSQHMIVRLLISAQGTIDRVEIGESSLPPAAQQALADAFSTLRFSPGWRGEKAVKSQMRIEVSLVAPAEIPLIDLAAQ